MLVIETHQLTKSYGRNRGIIDVNLQVESGEIFGFIGPNGAGKSTTIRTLLNFIFPDRGTATVFGLDCVRQTRAIKQQVGYIPGEVAYYADMRVKDLLSYAASFYQKRDPLRLKQLCDRFEVDTEKRVSALSSGNKKKVAIIQALLHRPRLLILDEPTNGLDPLMQQTFFSQLQEENKGGTTVFFSSHILSEVERLCARVAIIREGRILKVETINSLKEKTVKKVRLQLARVISPAEMPLLQQTEVSRVVAEPGQLRFFYQGDIQALMQALTTMPLTNVWLEEPTLEEIFLHVYADGGEPA